MSAKVHLRILNRAPEPAPAKRTRRRPRPAPVQTSLLDHWTWADAGRQLPATYGECQVAREDMGPLGLRESAGTITQARERLEWCPFLSCRHHLWQGRADEFEAMIDSPPKVWPQTCSLDVARAVGEAGSASSELDTGHVLGSASGDHGKDADPSDEVPGVGLILRDGLRLSDVGEHMGMSGERARQIEAEGLTHMRARHVLREAVGDVEPWAVPTRPRYAVQALMASVAGSRPKVEPERVHGPVYRPTIEWGLDD